MERKEEPSVPPDYVTLAQLQERWLKKQEELKLKKAQEEEIKSRPKNEIGLEKVAGGSVRDVPKNDGHGKRGGGFVRDVPRRRVKNDGHEKRGGGFARDVPRGRVKIDGGEIGVVEYKEKGKEIAVGGFQENQKNQRDKSRSEGEKMKSVEDGEKVEQVGKEIEIKEIDGENRDVKKIDFGGGLERNDTNIRPTNGHGKSKEVYRVRVNELKQSEEVRSGFGGGKKWRGRGQGRRRNGSRLKEEEGDKPGALEGNQESEKDEIPLGGLSGIDKNGGDKTEERKVEDQLNENEVLAVVESAKNGDKGEVDRKWERRRRNGVYPSRRKEVDKPGVLKGNRVSKKDEISVSGLSGIHRNGGNKMEDPGIKGELNDNEVLVVVESAKNGGKGGVGKNGNMLKEEEDNPGALKGNGESEKDEISLSSLSGIDRNGGNKTEERRVEGQLNDNEVLVVESAKNGDKGEVGKEYNRRKYGNWNRNKPHNARLRNVGRFEGRLKPKHGMMWVEKEKSGAAAEVGRSSLEYR